MMLKPVAFSSQNCRKSEIIINYNLIDQTISGF